MNILLEGIIGIFINILFIGYIYFVKSRIQQKGKYLYLYGIIMYIFLWYAIAGYCAPELEGCEIIWRMLFLSSLTIGIIASIITIYWSKYSKYLNDGSIIISLVELLLLFIAVQDEISDAVYDMWAYYTFSYEIPLFIIAFHSTVIICGSKKLINIFSYLTLFVSSLFIWYIFDDFSDIVIVWETYGIFFLSYIPFIFMAKYIVLKYHKPE